MKQARFFSHETEPRTASDDWLTPPEIIRALGEFDLDPCASMKMPWRTAARMLTVKDNGLATKWEGRVFLNPPYGRELGMWLERIAAHGDGIALTYARTETDAFQRTVFPRADAILFIAGRIAFYRPDGTKAGPGGGPSVLIAYGERNIQALFESGIRGAFVLLRRDIGTNK